MKLCGFSLQRECSKPRLAETARYSKPYSQGRRSAAGVRSITLLTQLVAWFDNQFSAEAATPVRQPLEQLLSGHMWYSVRCSSPADPSSAIRLHFVS
jgi:hypothetical protein